MARKKRLNKNLVVGLTFLGFMIVTGTGLLLVMQFRTTDPSLLEEKGYACLEADPPEYENALTYFVRAYSVSGDDPKYLLVIGDIYWDMGEDQKARGVWDKAAVEDPENVEAQEKRLTGRLDYLEFYDRPDAQDMSHWRLVLEPGGSVLRLEPENAIALYAMGTALKSLASAGQIDSELTQAWREQDVSSLDSLRKALGALGDAIGADSIDTSENWADVVGLAALEKACELDPLNVSYVNRLATFLSDSSSNVRNAEAEKLWLDQIEAFGDAQGVDPSKARLNYARYLTDLDDDEAIQWYEDAVRAAGDDRGAKAEAFTQFGTFWADQWGKSKEKSGDGKGNEEYLDNAIQQYEMAIAEDPGDFTPYQLMNRIYLVQEMPGKALETIGRRLDILDQYPIDRKSFKRSRDKTNLFTFLVLAAEQKAFISEQLLRVASKLRDNQKLDEETGKLLKKLGIALKPTDEVNEKMLHAQAEEYLRTAMDDIDKAESELEVLPKTLETRATVYRLEGDLEKAIELRKQSKELRGSAFAGDQQGVIGLRHREAILNQFQLAKLLMMLKRYGAAQAELAEVCADPFGRQLSGTLIAYAECLRQMEEYTVAIRILEDAKKLSPGNRQILRLESQIRSQRNDVGDADEVKKILAGLGQSEGDIGKEASMNLIRYEVAELLRAGEKEAAIAKAREAYEKEQDELFYLFLYARVLNEAGESKQASSVLQNYLDENPESPQRENVQAMLVQLDDTLTEAEKIEQVVDMRLSQIGDIDDPYHQAMAYAQFYTISGKQQDFTEADKYLKKAQDCIIDGTSPAARKQGKTILMKILGDRLGLAVRIDADSGSDTWAKSDAIIKTVMDLRDISEDDKKFDFDIDEADVNTFIGRVQMQKGLQCREDVRKLYMNGQTEEAKAKLLEGQDYLEAAVLTLNSVADQQQTNVEILSDLAKCYYYLQDHLEARNTLSRVIDIDPRNGWAYRMLAQLTQNTGQEDQFRNYVTRASELLPNDPWIQEQMLLLAEQDEPEKAIVKREETRKENPDDVENLIRLAALYTQVEGYEDALGCYEQVLALVKNEKLEQYDYGLIINLAAVCYRMAGEPLKGRELLEEYATSLKDESPEESAMMYLRLGNYLRSINQGIEADEAVRTAEDLSQSPTVCANLASYYSGTKRAKKGVELIRKAIKEAEKEKSAQAASYRIMEIKTLRQMHDRNAAEKAVTEFRERYPDNLYGLVAEAQVAQDFGDNEKALESYSEFIGFRPDALRIRFARAQLLATLKEWNSAIQDLEYIRSKDPALLNFQPLILLSNAYEKIGKRQQSIDELENILDDHPEQDNVALALVNRYVDYKEFGKAESLLANRQNRSQRDYEKAKKMYEDALEEDEGIEILLINRLDQGIKVSMWLRTAGEVAAKQEMAGEAFGYLRKACEVVEGELVDICQGSSERRSQACTVANQNKRILNQLYLDTCIQLGKAKQKLVAKDSEKYQAQVLKIYEAGSEFYENLPADQRKPELMCRYAYILVKEEKCQNKGKKLQAQDGKVQEAAALYLSSIDQEKPLTIPFLGVVTNYVFSSLGPELALEVFSENPTDQRLQDSRDILYSLLLENANEIQEALDLVNSKLEKHPARKEKAFWLIRKASLYSRSGKPQEAKKCYEQSLEEEGNNYIALNNLAYLLTEDLKQPEQALAYAQKAIELKPDPPILDTLGWVYVKLGKYQDAIGMFVQALSRDPAYFDATVHLADAYRLSGNFERAGKILEDAAKLAEQVDVSGEALDRVKALQKKVQARDRNP